MVKRLHCDITADEKTGGRALGKQGVTNLRELLSLGQEPLTAMDLNASITPAETLHQHHREAFTTPFPKASSRWLSQSSHRVPLYWHSRVTSKATSVGSLE
jgi:hypothetical protein